MSVKIILKEEFNHSFLFYYTKEIREINNEYIVLVFKHFKGSSVCDIVEKLSFDNVRDAKNYFKKGRLL